MKPARPLLLAVALSAVAALLPTPPAGAITLNNGTVTGGTLSVNLVPALTVGLDGAAPAPCPVATPMTVGLNVTANVPPPGWTTGVATVATAPRISFTYAGATWFLDLSRSAAGVHNGTIGAAPGYAWSQGTRLDAQIYPETAPPGSCIPNLGAPRCAVITVNVPAGGLNGALAGGGIAGETIAVGTVGTVNGAGAIAAFGCVAPFAALNAKVATFTAMAVTW